MTLTELEEKVAELEGKVEKLFTLVSELKSFARETDTLVEILWAKHERSIHKTG